MKIRKLRESTIQKAVVRWLRKQDTSHLDFFTFTAVCNERDRNQQHWIDMGQQPGWPDLMFIWSASDVLHVGFIEMKTKKGKVSNQQQLFLSGAECYCSTKVCRSSKEAKETLKEWLQLEDS